MGKQKEAAAREYQIRLSDNALKNFDEITGYIAFVNHEPANAIKVGDALMDAMERIGLHPLAFRECAELPTASKMYRRAVCLSWLIIYKISGKEIVILGIIHGSRLPKSIKTMRKIK